MGEQVGSKELVASMYTGGYDWGSFGLFRDSAGRLFTAEDGGCSCNGPWEDPEYLDFQPVDNVQDAMKRARAKVGNPDSSWDTYDESDYESFVKEALEVR